VENLRAPAAAAVIAVAAVAVAVFAVPGAAFLLLAWALRRRYTSPERWAKLMPKGKYTEMHAEQDARDGQGED
jgi:hypothetical protein